MSLEKLTKDLELSCTTLIMSGKAIFFSFLPSYSTHFTSMMVNIQANRFARVCYEEAFKYACKRETFDKKLIEHPVIREKFAQMVKKIEATHALLER